MRSLAAAVLLLAPAAAVAVGEHFTVSDKIDTILQRVADGMRVRFSDLFGEIASREFVAQFAVYQGFPKATVLNAVVEEEVGRAAEGGR